jgi:hypothetical protein
MEQDDKDSRPDETNPLTTDAPSDLLSRMLAPLGLQPPDTTLHAELQPDARLVALKSLQWTERVVALQALRTRAGHVPVRLVLEALHDENEHVRAAAARVLEKAHEQEVSQQLFSALHDTSWSVRAAAAQTLGRLGSRAAIKPLIELTGNDEDEAVRAAATEALGHMKDAVPLQPLLMALRDRKWLVREAAISALVNSGQHVPREVLLAACQDADISVREVALTALQRLYPGTMTSIDTIAQAQTQSLPAQEGATNSPSQHTWRLLSLLPTIRQLLSSIQRAAVYDAEQETIQYVPLPPAPSSGSARRWFPKAQPLLSLLGTAATVLVVVSIILASFLLFRSRQSSVTGGSKPAACPVNLVTSASLGCAFFRSSLGPNASGLNTSKGINDILEIDLANVPAPAAGKSYYGWLLGSATNPESTSVFLRPLAVEHGNIHAIYQEPQQNDLLIGTSVFLITEEASSVQPIVPSPDQSAWRYYDALSQTPDPKDTTNHFSVLDHLHHLLTADPQLESVNLHGGLGIWLQNNSLAIMKQAQQAQKAFTQHNVQTLRTQLTDILTYLDSSVYVYKDLPAGTVLHNLSTTSTRVAILTLDPLNQVPAGYVQHIAYHLNAIAANPSATSYQRNQATKLTSTLSAIEMQFQQIRTNVKTLVNMKDKQLLQTGGGALLNALLTQTSQVYQGQVNPTTGTIQQDGITQLYQAMQMLAGFNVQGYKQ